MVMCHYKPKYHANTLAAVFQAKVTVRAHIIETGNLLTADSFASKRILMVHHH